MGREGNIIIFDDLAVFSSFPKETTLDWMRQSKIFMANYTGKVPINDCDRILISIVNGTQKNSTFIISTFMSALDTADRLEIASSLLEKGRTEFFCPNESF